MPLLAYLAILFLPGALSQATSLAVCSEDSLRWSFNSVGDSPCQIAADLAGVCNGGVFTLKPLDPGFLYLGPTPLVQNSCRCSSVYYSMLSACAACQGRNWLRWDDYDANCTQVYSTVFPQAIPAGTRVPGWAYADISVTNGFNITVAESLENRPESTAVPSATSALTPPTFSTTGFTTPRSGGTSVPDSSGSSGSGSHAGAIAGGVIGGVVGLALIAGLVFFFLRRRREASEKPPSSAFNTTAYTPAPYNPDQSMSTASPYPATQSQKLYDPSDPSTFPYTNTNPPPPASTTYTSFQGSTPQVAQPHIPTSAPTGHYTGAPEL